MGAQFDCLRYEVFQNLFLSPMNTDLLRPAVATAPTVYGIETIEISCANYISRSKLQQHLPFTVLKHYIESLIYLYFFLQVATAPTVYGIETYLPHQKFLV